MQWRVQWILQVRFRGSPLVQNQTEDNLTKKEYENFAECPCLEDASISVPDIKGTGVH